jgi:hypothetical protein
MENVKRQRKMDEKKDEKSTSPYTAKVLRMRSSLYVTTAVPSADRRA